MNIKEREYFKEEETKVSSGKTRLPDLEDFTLLDLIPLTLFQDIYPLLTIFFFFAFNRGIMTK